MDILPCIYREEILTVQEDKWKEVLSQPGKTQDIFEFLPEHHLDPPLYLNLGPGSCVSQVMWQNLRISGLPQGTHENTIKTFIGC